MTNQVRKLQTKIGIAIFTLCMATGNAFGQTYTPLTVSSGFNADIVAEDYPRSTHTTADADGANYYFMSTTYPGATVGLPASGSFTSETTPGLPFQLAPYNGNNSLRITGTGSGTIEFSNPTPASTIYILATSGSGSTTFDGTLTFTDNTAQTFSSQSVSDWFGGTTNVAIKGIGRINNTAVDNNSNDPRLYQFPIAIASGNQSKFIKSITINKTSSNGVLQVMGATATVDYCIPTRPVHGGSELQVDLIDQVKLDGETSGPTLNNGSTRTKAFSYYDFTTGYPIPELNSNTTYSMTIKGQGNNQHTAVVWIDFNGNGVFENSERVGSHTQNGSGTFSFNITTPTGITAGNKRMRVLWQYNPYSNDYYNDKPCTADSWGLTEDYTIKIIESCVEANAGTISSDKTLVCANDDFVLTANGASSPAVGLTYQWQASLAGANNWQTISGATTQSHQVNGITQNMDYRFVVSCENGNLEDISNTVTVSVKPANECYCEVTSTSTTYGIGNFTTTNGVENINNASGAGSYSDYTNQVVSQIPGESIDFSISSASSSAGMAIWVDWNNNGSFDDPGEKVYASGAYVTAGTGTIVVPTDAIPGNHRMRVVANYLSTNPTPCGNLGNQPYGEAEDYTFSVIAYDGCYAPSSIFYEESGVCSGLLSWNAPFGYTALSYEYELRTSGTAGSGSNGLVVNGTTTDEEFEFNGVAIGQTYYFYLRTLCEEESSSDWSQALEFEYTEDYIPVSLTGFNADIVAEEAHPFNHTTSSVDNNTQIVFSGGNNYVFYAEGYSGSASGTGFPVDGKLQLGNRRFQLADYSGNNALRLTANETKTLQFTEHKKAGNIYVLGTSTEGESTFDVKAIFEDDSFEIIENAVMPDWADTDADNFVMNGLNVIQRGAGGGASTWYKPASLSGGNLKLFEVGIEIQPENHSKKIKEIEVTTHSSVGADYPFLNIMAVSMANAPVYASVVPSTKSICHGNEVKIDGNVTNVDGDWSITLSTGDVITGNGDVTWSETIIPDGNGTFTVQIESVSDDITCINSLEGEVTLTMPVRTEKLSENEESKTCFISGSQPIHFYNDASGNYIGSINPNGREGTVTMTSYVHDFGSNPGVNDGTMYACDDDENELYRTSFMKRSFTVVKEGQLTSGNNMMIYLPFVENEYSDLANRSSSTQNNPGNSPENPFDNVGSLADIVITKYEGTTINGVPYDNCIDGDAIVVNQANSGGLNTPYVLTPAVVEYANNPTDIYYASFSIEDFSEMYLHGKNNNSPLPVELTSFSTSCKDDVVTIEWATASESNSDYFVLERSRTGESWHEVAVVPAAGNATILNEYIVNDPLKGLTYYRLRQVDYDGKFEIYGPISANCEVTTGDITIYPNPTDGKFVVQINHLGVDENIRFQLMDAQGKMVEQRDGNLKNGSNQFLFDNNAIAKGSYNLRVLSATNYRVIKVIVL